MIISGLEAQTLDQRGLGNGRTVVTGTSTIWEYSMVKNNLATRPGTIALVMIEIPGSVLMTALRRKDSFAASSFAQVKAIILSICFKFFFRQETLHQLISQIFALLQQNQVSNTFWLVHE